MKKLLPLAAALLLAFVVTGCETDGGIAAREKEKASVYATLKPWEKRYIEKGVIARGFTPDMVYMAAGRASSVETTNTADGTTEIWIYRNFYPTPDLSTARYNLTPESPYQPGRLEVGASGKLEPVGAGQRGQRPSISRAGGPQGGSMEPADMASFTLTVIFKDGKVRGMKLVPN